MKKIYLLIAIAFISINIFAQNCTNWAVNPSDQEVYCSGGNFYTSISATGSCTYSYSISNSWISFVSYGTGGVLNYYVDANSSTYERTGYIYIYDVTDGDIWVTTLEIDQDACSGGCIDWAVDPSYQEVPCTGGYDYSATVSASGSCTFSYNSTYDWIHVGDFSGSTFYYDVDANNTGSPLTGYIDIYDVTDGNVFETSLEVYEDACSGGCTDWAVSPSEQEVPCTGNNYYTDVSATGSCTYNYTIDNPSGDPDMISFVSYGSGGELNYSVSANPTSSPQTGFIYINDVTDNLNNVTVLEVDQDACSGGCTNWGVSPSEQEVLCAGGTYYTDVTATGSCTYNYTIDNPSGDPDMISFVSYGSSGELNYSVSANPTSSPQTGFIYINDKTDGNPDVTTLEIDQYACDCTNWLVTPSEQAVSGEGTGGNYLSATVSSSGSCTYNLTIDNPTNDLDMITLVSNSNGTFSYNVAKNTSPSEETGYIYIYDITDGYVLEGTLVVTQGVLGITEINPDNNFTIYPNPSNDNITIESISTNRIKNVMISIYDLEGQLILLEPMKQQKTEFNISDLAKGVYVVKLKSSENIIVKRFVKD